MRHVWRVTVLLLVSLLSLQLYFAGRIALMRWVDPQSTTFQRAEMRRLIADKGEVAWSQQWVPAERISHHLRRAVIASEDANFAEHGGVEWDAIERAWNRNQKAEARVEKLNQQAARRKSGSPARPPREPKVVGGSTITQQLAKNLFLGSERTLVRKGQEFVITGMLEALLPKERILEIYLNNVEWGEGVFGAEAASQHYFRIPAASLGTFQAARLAVMLPAPKRHEKAPASAVVMSRAARIQANMGGVELP